MSSSLYTPTINLGFNLAYYKELKVIFCSNNKCNTSINTSSSSTSSIVKKHLLKHSISLKDLEVKELLFKVESLEIATISSLNYIESYKYYIKELGLAKEGYLCLVSNCNSIFINTKSFNKHLLEHTNKEEIQEYNKKRRF